ncbi:zinc finger protein 585A-like isoform X2 [Sceloporus undulatus]|uniref:zinc finger protein 585A-like isoform X2 n=1 Tax=Sceloporus undulatus TaxID=8520 RepID=UPI001C4C309B|nr:zinc finger protein 585A-like isoform X2 [Sceloporus undulatus]
MADAGAAGKAVPEAPVRFEDVVVYFLRDEWKTLEKWQKDLYWKVLKDNYEALVLVGHPVTKADVLAWIERHERQNGNKAQPSKASTGSGFLCPSNQRHGQMCHKESIKQAGSPQVICDRSKADPAPHNGIRRSHRQRLSIPSKQHECEECGKTFRLKILLQIHQETKARKESFPCPECKTCFFTSSRLKVHRRTHFQGFRRKEKRRLQENQLNAHCENYQALVHWCRDCRQGFRRYFDLLQHKKSHEVAEPWLCAECGVVFTSQGDVAMHEERHLEEVMHEHVACGQNCICEPSLQLHFASQTDGNKVGSEDHKQLPRKFYGKEGKPFSCVHCGSQFQLEVNLGMHYRYCLMGKQLKWGANDAPQNLKVQTGQGNSDLLHSQHPSQTSAQRSCPDPGKSMSHRRHQKGGKQQDSAKPNPSVPSAGNYDDPPKTCATKKLHKCHNCEKAFVYKWQLAIHLKSHGTGKGVVCKSSLWSHRRTHQGEASYKEEDYQKNLVPAANRSMDKEKTLHPCDKCGRSLTLSYMPDHQAFHAGVRYKCLFCGKIFNFKSGALSHLKHHKVEGGVCSCPKCKGSGGLPSEDCLCRIQKIRIAPGLQAQDD